MTEINIILDTNFQDLSDITLKNDKELFYELLEQDLNIYTFNSYSKYKIEYNQILHDLLENDNYLDYENELFNIHSINIKKLIIKRLFSFFNPIIKKKIKIEKTNIIDKDAINLNFPIDYKSKSNENKILINQRLQANMYFLLFGIFNKSILQSNLPYKLDNYKFINNYILDSLSYFNKKNHFIIKTSDIKYNNYGIFNVNSIENDILKGLYLSYVNSYQLYINNYYLSNSNVIYKSYNTALNNLYKQTKLVNTEYSKNYITLFNTFLSYKINDYFNNHSYYAFQSSDLLSLYEHILVYSIDNKDVKNKIKQILFNIERNKKIYSNKITIDKYNLQYIQLEYLTKTKFPNLFNPNSKDVIFYEYKKFNLDDLPKKYKDIILIEYKKLQNKILLTTNNKCKHKELLNNLYLTNDKFPIIKEINKLIQNNNISDNDYYKCLLCSYNLICPHVLEYYNLLFSKKETETEFSIRQHIINKYMTNAKINMIYYCKACGEELGRSLELEQNIEYKDKVKLNSSEYTDETVEMIRNNITHIIYSYITFTTLNINISKRYLINYVMDSILSNINIIEKSLRKSKVYNNEQILNLINFNSIVFIYATLIFIMTKYPFISFINNKKYKSGGDRDNSIIIPRKIEIKSNKDLLNLIKLRFKEAHEIIISTNNILLYKLKYNKQYEKIKELLIKTYGIVATNNQMTLNIHNNKLSNSNLLDKSSIYNYYYLIKQIYPTNDKSIEIPSIFKKYMILNSSSRSKLTFLNYDDVLNLENVNSNKNNNLFSNFESPIINEKYLNYSLQNNKINDYNEYKIISFNLFYFYIKYELYNLPIYNYITTEQDYDNIKEQKSLLNNVYFDKFRLNDDTLNTNNINSSDIIYKYIKLSHLVKLYEYKLMNENIEFNLYPYSLIKLNNSRYFSYNKNDINLNLFFCSVDGQPHNFNTYVYLDSKKDVFEFNKKEIDSNINKLSNLRFDDYKCSKCKLYKNKLKTDKSSNSDIIKLINENNDKDGFFNLYINVCPIFVKQKSSLSNNSTDKLEFQYHNFINDKNNDQVCKICNIKYSELLEKNINIYLKFNKEYSDYKIKKQNIINEQLIALTNKSLSLSNINIDNVYLSSVKNLNMLTSKSNIIDYVENLDLDTLLVFVSKKNKINIIFLQKLGLTEGHNYDENKLQSIENSYNILRINKLISYFRTILIYYNLLKYANSNFNKLESDFFKIINDIHMLGGTKAKLDKFLPSIEYNILDLTNLLKLNYDNKYIVEFFIKLIIQFILDLNLINETKFDNKLDLFIEFLFNKILKYDELFTNFNYSQLKQMFNEDKFENINEQYNDDYDDENEDDDELFGYTNLNIQFEDENPLDE